MVIGNGFLAGLALSAGLALPVGADALEVHKWLDGRGVMHYSESPPLDATDIASVETLQLNDEYKASASAKRGYKAILEVAERLEASRLVRERQRAREDAQERRATESMSAPQYGARTGGYPITFPYASGYHSRHYIPHYRYYDSFPYDGSVGLARGSFVPSVKQRSFFHNPAARARAEGGEPFSLH